MKKLSDNTYSTIRWDYSRFYTAEIGLVIKLDIDPFLNHLTFLGVITAEERERFSNMLSGDYEMVELADAILSKKFDEHDKRL